ncbi:MAG TPA: hypothetical protein VFI92_12085 [Steroidobacteraceae bacterium]|nr:hypothetical protein [Steroidobacteraceae bacterium]
MLYATGAWGFLQGLGYLTELFGWPNELPRVVALALLAGLPEVLVVAWFHGDRGDQGVTGTELALITLLFLLGGGLFWVYQHAGGTVDGNAVEHARAGPSGDVDRRPVVAVLPFENRSDQAADAHFVDGVHDDLLTQLTKAGSLRVVARTSVAPYRGSRQSTQQIATALGATMLVEGGVQRSGGRVRVTVQLVDGSTAVHLWAEHYDRDLSATNALEVQRELGVAVSDALENVLTGDQEPAGGPQADPHAAPGLAVGDRDLKPKHRLWAETRRSTVGFKPTRGGRTYTRESGRSWCGAGRRMAPGELRWRLSCRSRRASRAMRE